jgi:hypothetical protein
MKPPIFYHGLLVGIVLMSLGLSGCASRPGCSGGSCGCANGSCRNPSYAGAGYTDSSYGSGSGSVETYSGGSGTR